MLVNGIKVMSNPMLMDTVPVKTSRRKKKRIIKKFRKKYGTKQIPSKSFYLISSPISEEKILICHPTLLEKLRGIPGGEI